MEKNWRNKYNVLVPQADSMGAIAAIRSLGEHGYIVYSASSTPGALGCQSNFSFKGVCCPPYGDGYLDWLRNYILKYNIRAIIPSEGFLLAIKEHYDEFVSLLPLSSKEEIIYQCLCKVDVFNSFLSSQSKALKEHIPTTLIVNSLDDIPKKFQRWQFPLFIKGDAFYQKNQDQTGFVGAADNYTQAYGLIVEQLSRYKKVLVQSCFQGEKVTVNLLNWNNVNIAESMVLARHQNPHTGGLMSLRRSWWHDGIYEDAIARRNHLGWHGAGMFEYKWNKETGDFCFIEFNSRYWGALNLDILAGIHFPCYQIDAFLEGLLPDKPIRLTKNITVRNTLPADFGYTLSILKDKNISLWRKTFVFIEFFLLFLHPYVQSDLLYRNDRKLYFINLWDFIKEFTHSCLKRLK